MWVVDMNFSEDSDDYSDIFSGENNIRLCFVCVMRVPSCSRAAEPHSD